ncbi:MAG TPA: AMP-binding protein, partial [Pirellulales bacterium]|nr:AMP-binding protein [Pirellulales bacterium]
MDLDRLPGSFFGPPTLVELLRHRAAHHGSQAAYTFLVDGEAEEVHLTYAELDQRAQTLAGWLQAEGFQGDRALLLYPAGIDFIVGFFGCLYAGVVAVPAYPPRMNRSLDRIQSIAADAQARVALTTGSVLDRVRPLLKDAPELEQIAWLATDRVQATDGAEWRDPGARSSTLAFLQYTSGSTGTPKGVMLTHANLLHNCAIISFGFEHTRASSGVFWLPCHHDMGLVGGILAPLYMGCPNVLMSPMSFLQRPFRWLQAISRYRGTTSGGPNFAYDLCVRKVTAEQRAQLDLSCWDLAFNGAEPVRAESLDRFAEMFEPCGFRREAFYPCYGLAEATLIVSGGLKAQPPVVRSFDSKALENRTVVEVSAIDENSRKLVGSGQSLADEEIVIADPETLTRCAPGQVGEIWVVSPSIAQGYWRRREETEHAFRARLRDTSEGPYLRTGDLGFFQDGELFVAGRLKDLIIIRGLNHYPHDIELTVEKSHDAVRPGCGAAFTVDRDHEAKLLIVYEVERRQASDLAPVFDAIRRDVAREHELQVDSIVLVRSGSIPKTSSGKIQRHACRAAFLENSLEVVGRSDSCPGAWDTGTGQAQDVKAASESATGEFGRGELANDRSPAMAGASDNGRGAAPDEDADKRAAQLETAARVLDEVQRIAKERAKGLTLDSSIVDLGLDSLERMEILNALEERFGGRFPEEVMPQLETCREVVDAVERYLGGGEAGTRADDLPPENYRFDCYPEYIKLKQDLGALERNGIGNPFFNVHERVTNDTTMIGGRELINFSSYNYLGMSGDPVVAKEAKTAIDRFGTSVSASRVVSGEKTIH